MRLLAAACLLLLLALAGCSDTHRPPVVDPGVTPEPEDDNAVFFVSFEAGSAPATLEVPFPTLDSCRGVDAWMAGHVEATNATVEVRDAGDGRTGKVVAVTGSGHVSWSSQIEPGPRCETFRYDPWTIDPDRDDGQVEVRAASGSPAQASVLVRLVRENCGNASLYEGEAGTGWTAFAGRTIPTACG